MSRHHHIHANQVSHFLHDIEHLPHHEIERTYGVEVRDSGEVFDPTYNQTFGSLLEWAEFCQEQDEMEFAENFGHGKQTHEDFH